MECLNKELSITVKVLKPLYGIAGLSRSKSAAVQLQKPFSQTAGLGYILSNTSNLINLAPIEIHEEKQKRDQRHRLVKFLSLLFAGVILIISGQLVDIHKKQMTLQILTNDNANLKPQLQVARGKLHFVRSFDRKFKRSHFIPDVIDQLNRLTPEGISLRTLSLGKDGDLIISGYAKSNAGINDFQSRLIRSSGFHAIDLKFSTKRRIANMSIMDFKIASQLGDGEISL